MAYVTRQNHPSNSEWCGIHFENVYPSNLNAIQIPIQTFRRESHMLYRSYKASLVHFLSIASELFTMIVEATTNTIRTLKVCSHKSIDKLGVNKVVGFSLVWHSTEPEQPDRTSTSQKLLRTITRHVLQKMSTDAAMTLKSRKVWLGTLVRTFFSKIFLQWQLHTLSEHFPIEELQKPILM